MFNCTSSSSDLPRNSTESFDLVITDPPFGDNFIYSEMANFFYAWLRIPLSNWYPEFSVASKNSPNAQEAVKNVAHHPEDADEFYKNMMTACWSEACRVLKAAGFWRSRSITVRQPNGLSFSKPHWIRGFYLERSTRSPAMNQKGRTRIRLQEDRVRHSPCLPQTSC